jgi:hypothetical protein
MKPGKVLIAPSCLAACLIAQACVEYIPENGPPPQAPVTAQPPAPPAPPTAPPPPQSEKNAVDALVAPIALYPDPLIAIILPASTAPSDISAASAYLIQYGDATQIDRQPWDTSVRALAHYPAVLTWMANNMAWTQALGAEFIASPSDVMAAIQRLRERALVSGALAPSQQEQVVSEGGEIEIVPAQPDELYVPYYDADLVFMDGPYGGPPIYYGPAYPMGIWLSYTVDWHRRAVWVGGANGHRGPGGWYDPRQNAGHPPEGAKSWHPPSGSTAGGGPRLTSVPRPRPISGTPRLEAPRPDWANPARGESRFQQPAAAAPVFGRSPAPSEGSHAAGTPAHKEPAHAAAPAAAAPAEPKDQQPH